MLNKIIKKRKLLKRLRFLEHDAWLEIRTCMSLRRLRPEWYDNRKDKMIFIQECYQRAIQRVKSKKIIKWQYVFNYYYWTCAVITNVFIINYILIGGTFVFGKKSFNWEGLLSYIILPVLKLFY